MGVYFADTGSTGSLGGLRPQTPPQPPSPKGPAGIYPGKSRPAPRISAALLSSEWARLFARTPVPPEMPEHGRKPEQTFFMPLPSREFEGFNPSFILALLNG